MRNYLLNQIELEGTSFTSLSKELGIAKSYFNTFLKKEENINITYTLKIIRRLAAAKECELMAEFIYSLTKKDVKDVKIAMEYCSTRRMLQELSYLIELSIESNNKSLVEWGNSYRTQLNYQTLPLGWDEDLYDEIRDFHSKDLHLRILNVLQEIYVFNDDKDFRMVDKLLKRAEKLLNIPDSKEIECVKLSYIARLHQVKAFVELKVNNNFNDCRDSALRLIESNVGKSYEAYGYFVKGMSYFMEDYDKAQSYLGTSIQLYKEDNSLHNVKNLTEELYFLNFIWGKKCDSSHPTATVYNSLLSGNHNSINCEDVKTGSEGRDFLLKGIITGDKKHLYNSVMFYKSKGDNLLTQVSLAKLSQYEENESVLQYMNSVTA